MRVGGVASPTSDVFGMALGGDGDETARDWSSTSWSGD